MQVSASPRDCDISSPTLFAMAYRVAESMPVSTEEPASAVLIFAAAAEVPRDAGWEQRPADVVRRPGVSCPVGVAQAVNACACVPLV